MPGVPGHGIDVEIGGATAINGLTPPLLSSVEPSGMVPRGAVIMPMPIVPDDVPAPATDPMPVDPVGQAPMPPPSNVDCVPETPAEDDAMQVAVPTGGAVGLRPPGLISVAPSGIPVG